MEGRLTEEQRKALEDAEVRVALRYVIDEESFGELKSAHCSNALRDLSRLLGTEETARYCLSRIVDSGLATLEQRVYEGAIPLAGNAGVLVGSAAISTLKLNNGLPDGARWEIGRLLYTV